MKLWEALKIHDETGRKIRPIETLCYELDFMKAFQYLSSTSIDRMTHYLKCSWEVEPVKREVTREQIEKAFCKTGIGYISDERANLFFKELGL